MNHDTPKQFGKSLRIIRLSLDRPMTLQELAKKARLSKGLLSTIENGKGNPTLTTIARICRALKTTCTIGELDD